MILGHSKITEMAEKEKLIENFDEECLTGAGYDLRLGRVYKITSDGFIGISERRMPNIKELEVKSKNKKIKLESNEYVLVETIEKVNMPDNLIARILPRSSLFRCGCTLITAVVDPGYEGTLTVGVKNLSTRNFELESGARIGQIVFETIDGDTKTYSGRYQGGKVV